MTVAAAGRSPVPRSRSQLILEGKAGDQLVRLVEEQAAHEQGLCRTAQAVLVLGGDVHERRPEREGTPIAVRAVPAQVVRASGLAIIALTGI